MKTYQERKAERASHYESSIKGWKKVKCSACNGSGRYDNNRSPECSCCEGTGKMRVSPDEYEFYNNLE